MLPSDRDIAGSIPPKRHGNPNYSMQFRQWLARQSVLRAEMEAAFEQKRLKKIRKKGLDEPPVS